MENIHQEVYASLEITDNSLNFIVIHYNNNIFSVLYNKLLNGKFAIDGKIINVKNTAKQLQVLIKKVNYLIGLEVNKIVLVLPNNDLKIDRYVNTSIFDSEIKISKDNISNLMNSTDDIFIPLNEVICFIKPYAYIINNNIKTKQLNPPLDKAAKSLTIKSLLYTINKEILYSHKEVLRYSKVHSLSIIPRIYALGWSTGLDYLKTGLIIIDWNIDSLCINIFVKESLCEFKLLKEFGINKIINKLKYKFQISSEVIIKYLFSILNFNINNSDKLIIYNKILESKLRLQITMKDLQDEFTIYCTEAMKEINEYISTIFNTKNKLEYNIICTGEILKISGFKELMKKLTKYDVKFYIPNIIGMKEVQNVSLIGSIYYQHIINKINGTFITSI